MTTDLSHMVLQCSCGCISNVCFCGLHCKTTSDVYFVFVLIHILSDQCIPVHCLFARYYVWEVKYITNSPSVWLFSNLDISNMIASWNWLLQVNKTNSEIVLKFDDKEFHWKQSESLLTRLEAEGVVKLVFPLHGTLILILFMLIFLKLLLYAS